MNRGEYCEAAGAVAAPRVTSVRRKGGRNPGLVVAHSEDSKHRGQGGDNRKCDDQYCDHDQIAIKLHDTLGLLQLPLPLFLNKLLPVGGGNLGPPLSLRSGNNLTKGSCHRSSPVATEAALTRLLPRSDPS